MKTKFRLRQATAGAGALLALLLAVTLLPACSTRAKPSPAELAAAKIDDVETQVRAVVTDTTRATQVINLVDALQALAAAHNKALADHDQRLKTLLADYATSGADLQRQFDGFNAGRNARALRAVEIASQMRGATTATEWSALDKVRTKAMRAESAAARQD